jgi:hypothetical protein
MDVNMDISTKQDYTEISNHWPNPYAANCVYVPLAELVKAYAHLNRMLPASSKAGPIAACCGSTPTSSRKLRSDIPQAFAMGKALRYGHLL